MVEILNQLLLQIPINITGSNATLPSLPPVTLANVFGDMTTALIVITIMAAITVRTYSEYLEKALKGEISGFNPKYFVTALIAFFTSLPLALTLLPEASKIFLVYVGEWGIAGALIMAALYGYGWNHGTNKLASLTGHVVHTSAEILRERKMTRMRMNSRTEDHNKEEESPK